MTLITATKIVDHHGFRGIEILKISFSSEGFRYADHLENGNVHIMMKDFGFETTNDEWARIQPLLMPAAPVSDEAEAVTYTALPIDRTPSYYALSDAFQKAERASNWQDVGLILYPHVSYFLTGQTPKMPKASEDQYNRPSPLPTALISAYHRWKTDVGDPRAINDVLSTLEKCILVEESKS